MNSANPPQFIIDTSSIIAARREQYAPTVFISFETDFIRGFETGKLWMPPQVLDELRAKVDDIWDWAKAIENQSSHGHLKAQHAQAVENVVAELSPLYEKMARKQNSADLSVIAWAQILNATVVTQENPNAPTKIPWACKDKGVTWVNLLGMMEKLKWQY